jgi:hypothetical protein
MPPAIACAAVSFRHLPAEPAARPNYAIWLNGDVNEMAGGCLYIAFFA